MPQAPPRDRVAERRFRAPRVREVFLFFHPGEQGQPALRQQRDVRLAQAVLLGDGPDSQRGLGAVTLPKDAGEPRQGSRDRLHLPGSVPIENVETEPVHDLVFGRALGEIHPAHSRMTRTWKRPDGPPWVNGENWDQVGAG
jgi:hypothetical protein